jgi:hypothetical protein
MQTDQFVHVVTRIYCTIITRGQQKGVKSFLQGTSYALLLVPSMWCSLFQRIGKGVLTLAVFGCFGLLPLRSHPLLSFVCFVKCF